MLTGQSLCSRFVSIVSGQEEEDGNSESNPDSNFRSKIQKTKRSEDGVWVSVLITTISLIHVYFKILNDAPLKGEDFNTEMTKLATGRNEQCHKSADTGKSTKLENVLVTSKQDYKSIF